MFSRILAASLALGLVVARPVDEYDYVIIGSGPGGGTLAANLATNGYSVFLIEAGGDASDDILERLPNLSATAAETPGHSWQFFVNKYDNETQARRDPTYTYRTTNGSYYSGLNPPQGAIPIGNYYPRGSTLGGSSQVNAMNFQWSPDSEWDYIAELTGDSSWGHEHMRRHLMSLENATYVPKGTPGHGHEGFLEASMGNATVALTSPNYAAVVSELLRQTEGIDTEDIGEISDLLHRDINRIDSDRYNNTMYITPGAISPTTASRSGIARHINEVIAEGYPLTLSFHSLATRVLFDQRGNATKPKAFGVEYMVGEALYSADGRYDASKTGELRTVRAKKEVIVSGGAFNTPQILKLSGVGPRDELEEHGIPVVAHVPAVGKYLHDNYEMPLHIRSTQPWLISGPSECTLTFDESDPCFVEWENEQSGPYASRGGTFGMVWRSSQSWDNDSDLMLLNGIGIRGRSGFYPGYSRERVVSPGDWALILVKMQTANAAGSVTLRSNDPRQAPEISFNYYAEESERDLQALKEGIDLLLNVFKESGVEYEVVTQGLDTDPFQVIKDLSYSHHASSTCRMGPAGDERYCVDSRFRIHGVDNLRVVDASILPRSPGGMINGPTFTVSQKAFEVIMEDNSGCKVTDTGKF